MIETSDVERLIQDPNRIRRLAYAAGRALNVLDVADISGRTPDGDVAAMSARSELRAGFQDDAALVRALSDSGETSGPGWPD